jgi:hypothetical protein
MAATFMEQPKATGDIHLVLEQQSGLQLFLDMA